MPEPDREFQQRLLGTFRGEAEEHVRAISSGLIELEQTPRVADQAAIVEKIFREAHSLKGAARAVNLKEIETICQSLEEVFARAKRQEVVLSAETLDVTHRTVDEIERLLGEPGKEPLERGPRSSRDLPDRLLSLSRGPAGIEGSAGPRIEAALPPAGPETKVTTETVRVPADQLDRLLLQVEELVPESMGVAHSSARLRELLADVSLWKHEWAKVQFAAKALDRPGTGLRRLFEFLEWNDEFFKTLERKLSNLSRSSERDQRSLGAMVDSLLRDTKLLLLRPFSSLTENFPKIARDLCRQQGKEVSLSVRGADIEIDRRILQEIKDPLIHILRNCIDHGVEKPEDRTRAKKAPQGAIMIAIEQKSANRVEIAISDDGAGIDPRSVRDAAVRAGAVSAESVHDLRESEILQFIFQSGVSTSPIVTDISGRGLGMAIVREKVERLGGEVTLDTRLGAGTTIRLLLPLTVSTVRGLLIRVGEQNFVIPVTFVERVASTNKESIQTVENRATALVGGQAVSFVRLHDVLNISPPGSGREDAWEPVDGRPCRLGDADCLPGGRGDWRAGSPHEEPRTAAGAGTECWRSGCSGHGEARAHPECRRSHEVRDQNDIPTRSPAGGQGTHGFP